MSFWKILNGIISPVDIVTQVLLDKKVRLSGSGLAYVDYNFGIGNLGTGASAPDPIAFGATNIQVLGFDGGVTTEQVFGVVELNHNWLEGSIIYPHIHWLPTTTGAGSVKWQLEYAILRDGELLGASNTLSVTQAAGGVAWTQKMADFTPAINMAGYTIETQFFFRLFRDPTQDDYGADAALATFGLHVQIDGFGSARLDGKN